MIDKSLLYDTAKSFGVTLSDEALAKFDTYAEMIVETNKVMNLTAITDPTDMVFKHFVDSLTLLPLLPKGPLSIIDVGTGAGFPGIPLLIARPELQLTLLDSLQKRLTFLQSVCDTLCLKATILHGRAEEAGHDKTLREQFDVVTARAVANLPVLSEWCIPLVKIGGSFFSMKGASGMEEWEQASHAITTLGGQKGEATTFTIPTASGESETRCILEIQKKKATDIHYPRPNGKIKKNPL